MGAYLRCECRDAVDGVFGAEEEARTGYVVDSGVKEEPALVGGVFTPFRFYTSGLMSIAPEPRQKDTKPKEPRKPYTPRYLHPFFTFAKISTLKWSIFPIFPTSVRAYLNVSRDRKFSATDQDAVFGFMLAVYQFRSTAATLRLMAMGFSERTCFLARRAFSMKEGWMGMGRLKGVSSGLVGYFIGMSVGGLYAIMTGWISSRWRRAWYPLFSPRLSQ